jgi:hypothetical protein
MPQFVFLLHEPPDAYRDLGPEEIQTILERYFAWKDRLVRGGHFVTSYKLTPDGRELRLDRQSRGVTDRMLGEAKEVVGGIAIVRADSFEEAVELARGSPHFERGWIEVRRVDLE